MTDLVKLYKKKPSLFVWTFFGLGIIAFMFGTLFPPNDIQMVDQITLLGEGLFASGIIVGAILVVKRKRKK